MRQILCQLAATLYLHRRKSISLLILYGLLGNVGSIVAQSYSTATGIPTFAAPEPVELGFADTANGRLRIVIKLGSYAQRGTNQPEAANLIYDSNIWNVVTSAGSNVWDPSTGLGGTPATKGGWILSQQIESRLLPAGAQQGCREDMVWQDRNGTSHVFDIPTVPGNTGCASSGSAYAADSSGYQMTDSTTGVTVYAPDGTLVYKYPVPQDANGNYIVSKDSNGNYLSRNGTLKFYDTLGRLFVETDGGTIFNPIYTVSTSQGTSQIQIATATITLNTHFQKSGVAECSTSCGATVIRSITLPDAAHSTYYFTYNCDSSTGNAACGSPSGQTYYYGEMISATLPTGATINYQYTIFKDAYNNNTRWLSQRNANNGDITTFTPSVLSTCASNQVGCKQQSRVVTPTGSKVYTFILNNGAYPITVVNNDGAGNAVSTVNNTWDFSQSCVLLSCSGVSQAASYVRLQTQQTTVYTPGGALTKQTQYEYDTPQTGNVTAVKEWGYYPGTTPAFPSVPDKATYTNYITTGSNNIDRPSKVTICNNSGSDAGNCPRGGIRVAQTIFTYDSYGTGGCPAFKLVSSTANHDDAGFGTSYTTRGNRTQIQRWVSGSTFLATQLCYDTTGQMIEQFDPAGNATVYDYTDNFFTDTGAASMSSYAPTSATNALPKTITTGGLTTTYGYYYGSNQQALATDPNNESTYNYFFDGLDRWTQRVYPVGWELQNYTSPTVSQYFSAVADTSATASCTSCRHIQTTLDSWARKVNEQLVNAPGGAPKVDTVYDNAGRVQTVTHAYVSPSDPSHVTESFSYDSLDRTIQIGHPDGQTSRTAYGASIASLGGLTSQASTAYGNGYPAIIIDETLEQKQQWTDGLDRIIEVDEPSVNGGTPGTATIGITSNSSQVSATFTPCPQCQPVTVYNNGTISLTVGGVTASTSFGPPPPTGTSTSQQIASALASQLNGSTIAATANGASIVVTATVPGTSTNYSFSSSATYYTGTCPSSPCFTGPAFSVSPSSGALTGGSGGISSSPFSTFYAYDAADHLTQVVQGVQTRTFQYDGLGRITSRTTPEAGTETLSYTTSAGALCAGDPEAVCRRTDGRGVTTAYTYDSANRMTGKTYSDGTPSVSYTYDQGGAAAHAMGRLTKMTDGSGSETYAYGLMGRVLQVTKVIGSASYVTGFLYNAAGETTQITYPSGHVVQQSYDHVGRLCEIAPTTSACGSASNPYATAYNYNAGDQLLGVTYGNGVVGNWTYNPASAMLSTLSFAKGANTYFSLSYFYQKDAANCPNAPSGSDGQIQCIVDTTGSATPGASGRSVTYTYDQLGRISTAQTTGSTQFARWGLAWTYDRYANRLCQNLTAGTAYQGCLSFANPGGAQTNRPDGWCFDGSGDLLSKTASPCPPPAPTFAWDAEKRMTSYMGMGGVYTYDGNDVRVKKVASGTTTVVIYSNGHDIAEYDNGAAPSSPSREYVYSDAISGAGLLASITGGASPTTTYYHDDHLDWRISTDGTAGSSTYGQVNGQQGHFPFGESWYSINGNKFVFTTYQREAESGLDYAMARYYDSTAARFCSADPVLGQPADPQSWNRYAYVRNDPVNKTDPTGKFWDLLAGLAVDLISSLFAAAPQVVVVTAEAPVWPTLEAAIGEGLVVGAAVAPVLSNPFDDPQRQVAQDASKKAEQRVQQGDCKTFIENLLAKLDKGTPGIGNSSATAFAKRIATAAKTMKISPIPFMSATGPDPNVAGITVRHTFQMTLYPRAFANYDDLLNTLEHEPFHMGPSGKGDVDIYNTLFDTSHRPHLPLTGSADEQKGQASSRWSEELRKHCQGPGGQ